MNTYKLDRFEGSSAILIQKDDEKNELSVLKERLIAFANPGDVLVIDFDNIGNLRQVEIVEKGLSPSMDEMGKA